MDTGFFWLCVVLIVWCVRSLSPLSRQNLGYFTQHLYLVSSLTLTQTHSLTHSHTSTHAHCLGTWRVHTPLPPATLASPAARPVPHTAPTPYYFYITVA